MGKKMKDPIGDRMKNFYEDRTRHKLTRRTYTIIRIDGKAFHSYTKGLKRPFDEELIDDMDSTAIHLCRNIMGAKLAYVQSDEISIVITDFDEIETQAWFDNNLQKMCSVSASLATQVFNKLRIVRYLKSSLGDQGLSINEQISNILNLKEANFDSRVFQIGHRVEVINYLIWRQQDAIRNSISSVAQSIFSHKELEGVKTSKMIEMIKEKNKPWEEYEIGLQRGRLIVKKETVNKRSTWVSIEPEIFSKDTKNLDIIP